MTILPEHLKVSTSERGFDGLPSIPGACGGNAHVYESSSAEGPHVWLAVAVSNMGRTEETFHLHLTAENAWKLAEQLALMVAEHYQGDARPSGRVIDFIGEE